MPGPKPPTPPSSKDQDAAPRGFIGKVKQLFRDVKKAITAAPQDGNRQRGKGGKGGKGGRQGKSGETDKGFGMAARDVLHHPPHSPRELYEQTKHYLADALDWMHLWNWNHDPDSMFEACDHYQHSNQADYSEDHLSLHL